MSLRWPFENIDGMLSIDGVSSTQLAQEFDTPLFVYSENRIRTNINMLKKAVQKHYPKTRILYACKANTNISILKILHDEGIEIDAVSPGEAFLALEAGYSPEEILFTGTSVREDELRYLVESGYRLNVDSVSQMRGLLKIGVPKTVSVRINPEVGAGHHEHVITAGPDVKFGVWESQAPEAYRLALEAGVSSFGIQMHIGSGIMDVFNFVKAVSRLLEIAKHVKDEVGIDFDFIDIGGGIGVPYKPGEEEVDLDSFFESLFGFMKEKVGELDLGRPAIWLEPGRYLVAESGVLLTTVTTLKTSPGKEFVGVDAGFNTLIRPAMYGSYHHIHSASGLDEPTKAYTVYGPLCESGDIFARDRVIPKVGEGGLLAIMNAGAYGFSMSSHYNSRPKAAEVMVKDGKSRLIRKRETLQDLLRGQMPSNSK
jgi:diaminopimelate decarboxylase